MKYIAQFSRILGFCLAGELLHVLLPLPVPAGVYGMVLLLLALKSGLLRAEQVQETGRFLTSIFLLLFIPGTVAIVNQAEALIRLWLPLVIAVIPVTALVFAAAGKTADLLMRRRNRG